MKKNLCIFIQIFSFISIAILAQNAQESKKKMIIASFNVPQFSENQGVDSNTLSNLLLEKALKSQRYQITLPGNYLSKILNQHYEEIRSGKLPDSIIKDIDKRELGGEFLLLPTGARLEKTNIITAVMIDLVSFTPINSYKAENVGDLSKILELTNSLWLKIDPLPPTLRNDLLAKVKKEDPQFHTVNIWHTETGDSTMVKLEVTNQGGWKDWGSKDWAELLTWYQDKKYTTGWISPGKTGYVEFPHNGGQLKIEFWAPGLFGLPGGGDYLLVNIPSSGYLEIKALRKRDK